MPVNLIKKYSDLLELGYLNVYQRRESLKGIFKRDIEENELFKFRNKDIYPTKSNDDTTPMERLFSHLTTVVTDRSTKKREFEMDRSVRLHWIKHHVEEVKPTKMLVFIVEDEKRVYILDKVERYVIIFEPLKKIDAYFLLTAYKLGSSGYRKILRKFEKRGKVL